MSSHYTIFYVYVHILFMVFSKFQTDRKIVEYEVKKIHVCIEFQHLIIKFYA